MASYEQLKPFYPKDMGNKKGWCLLNVAKGFHATPSANPSASAKADMEKNKAKGTFHSGTKDIPTNCAVPVYIKTTSVYGHVEVYDKGVYYNDGKKTNKPGTVLGWGEWCNGFQLVRKTAKRTFLPAKGYWGPGDQDSRIADLALFMRQNFPSYTSTKALGPVYGKNLTASIKEFQKRTGKRTGLYPDGCTGPLTYKKLQSFGFKY